MPSESSETVLVVDYDRLNRNNMENTLVKSNYHVRTSATTKEAFEIVMKDCISLVIIDCFMKDMDGFTFLKVLKQASDRDIPVILMSDEDDPTIISKAFDFGADDYFSKPIKSELILKRVRTHLNIQQRRIRERYLEVLLKEEKSHGVKLYEKIEEMHKMKQIVTEKIETPMSEVMNSIQELMGGNYGKEQYKTALSKILKSLSQSNLYKPAFVDIELEEEMDEETRDWLSSQFTTDEKSQMKTRRTSLPKITNQISKELTKIPFDLKNYTPSVNLKSLNFDATSFSRTELKKMVCWMFRELNFFSTYRLNEHKFWTMMCLLEENYKDNIYHNFMHACDVTQYIFMIITNEKVGCFLKDFDKFTLMVSGLFHDINHPGLNNIYLINSRDDLALIYNDISVLENYHAHEAFQILANESTSIIENLTDEEYQIFRKNFIKVILATDMSQHFTIVTKFQTRIEASPLNSDKEEDRIELMKIIMKCADISNITRPFQIAKKWAKNCVNEFFVQGDLEKEKQLPVGILNDRNNLNFPKSQIGFVDFVAISLFRNLLIAFPDLKVIYDTIEENKSHYKFLCESGYLSIKDDVDVTNLENRNKIKMENEKKQEEILNEIKIQQEETLKKIEMQKKIDEELLVEFGKSFKNFSFSFYLKHSRLPFISEILKHFKISTQSLILNQLDLKKDFIIFDQLFNQILVALPFSHFPTQNIVKFTANDQEIQYYTLSVFDSIGLCWNLKNGKIKIQSYDYESKEIINFELNEAGDDIISNEKFNFYLNSPLKKWCNNANHKDCIVISKSELLFTKLETSQVLSLSKLFYENYLNDDFKFPTESELNKKLIELKLENLKI